MRSWIGASIVAVLIAGLVYAQRMTSDQGRPGKEGAWSVSLTSGSTINVSGQDGGYPLEVSLNGRTLSNPAKTTTTVSANATSCTAAGGASCTIIRPSIDVQAYKDITLTVKNTGSAGLSDCLIEWSPDNTSFEVWDSTTFATLTTGSIKSISISGNSRRWIRVEGRSASGTTTDVWLTMGY